MQVPVQLAGRQSPLLLDVSYGCQTLQDVADSLQQQLEEGTWIDLDHDDVEPVLPFYKIKNTAAGPFHRLFCVGDAAGSSGSHDEKDGPSLTHVRNRRLLGHRPLLSAVPVMPFQWGVGRLTVRAWPVAQQMMQVEFGETAVDLLVQPHTPVAEYKALLAEELGVPRASLVLMAHNPAQDAPTAERELLLPDDASLCQLGVTPAWRLEALQGPLGDPLMVNVQLPIGGFAVIHATSGMKVAHLKQLLVAQATVPARAMGLTLRGRRLQDPELLSKHLRKCDTLQMTLPNSLTLYKAGEPCKETISLADVLPCMELPSHQCM